MTLLKITENVAIIKTEYNKLNKMELEKLDREERLDKVIFLFSV